MHVRSSAVCSLATAALTLSIAATAFAAAPATAQGESRMRIPFVVGLTTVRAVSVPEGDYETMRVIDAIDAGGYRIIATGEVPADDGNGLIDMRIVRMVSAEDQLHSRRMRIFFHTADAQTFSGTVPGQR